MRMVGVMVGGWRGGGQAEVGEDGVDGFGGGDEGEDAHVASALGEGQGKVESYCDRLCIRGHCVPVGNVGVPQPFNHMSRYSLTHRDPSEKLWVRIGASRLPVRW